MSDFIVTRWWWVRHLRVVDAHLGRLCGQTDVNADKNADTVLIENLASKLPLGAVWITSNLRRTRQTAEALWQAGAPRTELRVEADFAEQAFGVWSNRTWAEIEALDARGARAFWDAPVHGRAPGAGAESFSDVQARVTKRIQSLNRNHGGRDIVCIGHAGPVRAAVALALDLTPERALSLDIKNTSLTRVDYITLKTGKGSWRVGGINLV